MKKIDVFCASQASTAICMSMDQPSSSSTNQLGGRTLDRYNPIIRDQKRIPRTLPLAPCTSQPPPINPVPYQLLHKSKKSTSKNKASDQSSNKKSNSTKPKPKPNDQKTKKISFKPTDIDDDKKRTTYLNAPKDIVRRGWAKPGDFITPPGSSRYLLGDTAFFDGLADYDPVLAQLAPVESNRNTQALSKDESTASKPSSSSSSNPNQVCTKLWLSLLCSYNINNSKTLQVLISCILNGLDFRLWFWECHYTAEAAKEKWGNIYPGWKVCPCDMN